ncbi:MAG: restriction endonuclease subunit S, partial [Sulfurovum sp.]|nr:restriction endonuclease subunit S [Sulfurovum sp.]
MGEWREYKISDIADVIGGGTPKTSVDEYWNGDIPWLAPRDLTGYDKVYISHGDRFITEEGLKKSSTKLMPKGSVLLTSRAPIGYVAIAQNEICTNQGFKSLVPKKDLCYSEFLYYWIKSNIDYLQQLGTGTTFTEISGSVVKNIDILLPPLKEQKAIAEVLSSLDDKIDLLISQNKTLEALAQTLFRQWFIEEAGDEWEEKPLGEITDIGIGRTPPRKE